MACELHNYSVTPVLNINYDAIVASSNSIPLWQLAVSDNLEYIQETPLSSFTSDRILIYLSQEIDSVLRSHINKLLLPL